MDISNRTLGLLLVAAIVISIGGTFISLNRLDSISTTGFATNNETGTVQLEVDQLISITTADDDSIDFGTCALNGTRGYSEFASNGTSYLDNDECSGGANGFPGSTDSITVRNNGNLDANVTVRSNVTGPNLFTVSGGASTNTLLRYKTTSTSGGCASGDLQATWNTFAAADTDYYACDNLDFHASNNTMEFFVYAYINASVDNGGTSTVTFEGRTV